MNSAFSQTSATAGRWLSRAHVPLVFSALLAVMACEKPTEPKTIAKHEVSSESLRQSEANLTDRVILKALSRLRETDGTLLVGLKEPEALRGVTDDGVRLPVSARKEAERRLRKSFPQLAVLNGVRHEITYRARRGIRSLTAHRTYIRIGGRIDAALLRALRSHPNVDYVEPNWKHIVKRGASSNVLANAAQAFEQGPFAIATMRARNAWARGYRGNGISVGMVDTGIDGHDSGHPDILTDNTTNWMHYNATWGKHGDNSCTDVSAECWWERPFHGTGVFGSLAATENAQSSVGIAPAAIPALATVGATYINTNGQTVGTESDIADGVDAVTEFHNAYPSYPRVAVISIGFPSDDTTAFQTLHNSFRVAAATGRILWFAAAEQVTPGLIGIPGAFSRVAAVGGTRRQPDQDDKARRDVTNPSQA